ncbi:hypothetical protein NM688_g738 [Phlebia brevispora]|uniref:Uncharacterized protein n=1 Tax=Phlebia brevispora TaxID=194682 RepID=A0ACC1TE91_9APHY|nr:hypothetical protein NM688_g738 [Phlebia brevispora]
MSSQEFEDASHGNETHHIEEDSSPGPAPAEKRRRRLMVAPGDGGRMPGKQCSNCLAFKYTCTYTQASKKRFADPEYVQNLETQLARTQDLLQRLSSRLEVLDPHGTLADRHPGSYSGAQSPTSDSEQSLKVDTQSPAARLPSMASKFDQPDDDLDPSDDEMTLRHNLEQSIRHLSLEANRPNFLGKSSGLMFLQTALDLREQYVSENPTKGAIQVPLIFARSEFWKEQPWVTQPDYPYPIQAFPEPGLMQSLIDLYFSNYNIYMPLLHRPTFEKDLRSGLHLVDEGFGATVLLVCALGAKFSEDPRVLLEGVDSVHASGWKWFRAVQSERKAFRMQQPCLRDMQICCLAGEFLHSSCVAQMSFSIIGYGIRIAQDLGAHRRKVYATLPTAEGELLKRAFWILVTLDRALSSALGRACCIQDEDFDVDYVIECDDEYWYNEKGEPVFKQPPGKPSFISFFNSLIRLNQILGCVLRTIYAINKSKSLLGFSGPDWEQHIVTELDSALNKWVDTVPDHLKWDPNMENVMFLDQSAFLYTSYYVLQITIHRPYIPSPRKPSPLAFPSLAICTNAARSCIHVLDVQYKRSGSSTYQNMLGCFCSAVVLMLNIWGGRRYSSPAVLSREMADVHKVMLMLKVLEDRWPISGHILDVLCELGTAGGLPLPQFDSIPPVASLKHTHLSGSQPPPSGEPYPTKDSMPGQLPTNFTLNDVSLPMHSDELGRFPLHPAFHSNPVPEAQPESRGWTPLSAGSSSTPSTTSAGTGTFPGGSRMELDDVFSSVSLPTTSTYQTPENFFGYTPPPGQRSTPDSMAQASNPSHQSNQSNQNTWSAFPNMLNDDAMAMWTTAPSSMAWEDWRTYLMNINVTIPILLQESRSGEAYIKTLESRLENMESLIEKLVMLRDSSSSTISHHDLHEASPFVQDVLRKAKFISEDTHQAGPSRLSLAESEDLDQSDDEYSARKRLEEAFRKISFDPGKSQFFGKSSSVLFLEKAMALRQEYVNEGTSSFPLRLGKGLPDQRLPTWNVHPWLKNTTHQSFSFPPNDLMPLLIDRYFHSHNVYWPLLHRPTFDRSIQEGLHLRDNNFACVVLLVCAIGSRGYGDPRVLLDEYCDHHSAGWKWFRQAQSSFQFVTFEPPCLYDLQIIYVRSIDPFLRFVEENNVQQLMVTFIGGSSSPQGTWPLVGIGLRLAQAQGAHRRKTYESGPTVETELLKRAFCHHGQRLEFRHGKALCNSGRRTFRLNAMMSNWTNDDPNLAFKRPDGKPCQTSYFNCHIQLTQIHAFALRTLYSISKSKAKLGHAVFEWEERTVAELDSSLNGFMDSVPEHLRWNPRQKNMLFLNQAAALHVQYSGIQIMVHRPFISSLMKHPRSSFPSLSICTNAARSCIHVLKIQHERVLQDPTHKYSHAYVDVQALFVSTTVLLVNIWGRRRFDTGTIDNTEEMGEVHEAIKMLKDFGGRCFAAGHLSAVLREMVNVGNPSFDEQDSGNQHDPEGTGSAVLSWPISQLPAGTMGYMFSHPTLNDDASYTLPLVDDEFASHFPSHVQDTSFAQPSPSEHTSTVDDIVFPRFYCTSSDVDQSGSPIPGNSYLGMSPVNNNSLMSNRIRGTVSDDRPNNASQQLSPHDDVSFGWNTWLNNGP